MKQAIDDFSFTLFGIHAEMRIFLLIIILSLCLCCAPVHATEKEDDVMVLQSVMFPPYEQAFRGFEKTCEGQIRRVILSESKATDMHTQLVNMMPDIIVAIGRDALVRLTNLTDIPLVYFMVMNPESEVFENRNISGVSMNVSHDIQLKTLLKLIPHMKSLGLLYDPDRNTVFVEKARDAAEGIDVRLRSSVIHGLRDVPSALDDLKLCVDALWMLPDPTINLPEAFEILLLFSLENKIPILTFSEKYLRLGAFISISVDPSDVGILAGEMANRILKGDQTALNQHLSVKKVKVRINHKLAGKLDISIAAKILREVGSDG